MFFPTDILRAALHCVAGDDEPSEYLKGVYITRLFIKATDGRALVTMVHGAVTDIDAVFRVHGDIPTDAEGTEIMVINGQWVAAHYFDDGRPAGHNELEVIEGEYPDFDKLLPDEPEPCDELPMFSAKLLALPYLMFGSNFGPVKFKPYGKTGLCVLLLDPMTEHLYGSPLLVIMPLRDNAFELCTEVLNEEGI